MYTKPFLRKQSGIGKRDKTRDRLCAGWLKYNGFHLKEKTALYKTWDIK